MNTRKEFILLINKRQYREVVEVGVGWGGYSEFLLTNCPLIHLTSIDPWQGKEFRPGSKEKVFERLAKFKERSTIISKTSVEAAQEFLDESIDFVYIDGDHTSEAIKNDLAAWWPKVKKGGVMSGHDYDGRLPAVIGAVDTFGKLNELKVNVTGIEDAYTVEFGEEARSASWWFEKS